MKSAVFPRAWAWFFDEVLPTFVKNHYSPEENWKGRPFTRPDAIFFLKGVRELSDKFTEGRDDFRVGYFNHQKFRSSYLLYFLPLQCAKFLLLMDQHGAHLKLALIEAKKTGVLRVADVGAGPGTASIALLLYLLHKHPDQIPDRIEFLWIDEAEKMMEDGVRLVQELCVNFRPLEGRVSIRRHVTDWRKHRFMPDERYDLSLFGHVLNEGKSLHNAERLTDQCREWVERSGLGGTLFIEPAFRGASQLLSKLRDGILTPVSLETFIREDEPLPAESADGGALAEAEIDHETDEAVRALLAPRAQKKLETRMKKVGADQPIGVVGPCLHNGKCPLASGKDWCHFSTKAETPGKWFEFFSKGLSSQREWIKYSYVWLRSNPPKKAKVDPNVRLVLTDSLTKNLKSANLYLLCEPIRARRVSVSRNERLRRGDLYKLPASRPGESVPNDELYDDDELLDDEMDD